MRIRILSLLAALLALAGLATLASPANAAGRFDWGADIKHEIKSRSWTQNSGTVEIQAACKLTNGEKFTITLYKESDLSDASKGTKSYTCTNSIQTQKWTGMPSGRYYFDLKLATSHSSTVHFSGNVFYP